jgi:putative metallohydrolase (TIGR04338 family)
MSTEKCYRGEQKVCNTLDSSNPLGGNAVFQVAGSSVVLPVERKFANLADVQGYVDLVLAAEGLPQMVRVRDRKCAGKAHYQGTPGTTGNVDTYEGVIAVPLKDYRISREMTVLHELAHHVTALAYLKALRAWVPFPVPGGKRVGLPSYTAHGPEFRQSFLGLLDRHMACEVAFALTVCWAEVA